MQYYKLLFLLITLLWTTTRCTSDDTFVTDLPYKGKIKSLSFKYVHGVMADTLLKYDFIYNEQNGQLLKISKDSIDICTIVRSPRGTLLLEWRAGIPYEYLYDRWLIETATPGKLSAIWSVPDPGGDSTFVYRVRYQTNGVVDTLYYPDQGFVVNIKNYGFQFQNGNCVGYQSSTYVVHTQTYGEATHTINYNGLEASPEVPFQLPQTLFFYGTAEIYLNPFYILRLVGINFIDPNQHLVRQRDNTVYSYSFDSVGRVTMVERRTNGTDTLPSAKLEYY